MKEVQIQTFTFSGIICFMLKFYFDVLEMYLCFIIFMFTTSVTELLCFLLRSEPRPLFLTEL